MRPFDIEQLAWAHEHAGRHRYDLANSAICAPDLGTLGLPATLTWSAADGIESVRALGGVLGARYDAPGGEVHLTTGASEANAIVVAALAGADGEVLVERPGYQPMRRAPLVFGTRVRTFERFARGGPVAAIEAALTARTWLVSIADLHNPTGAPLAESDVRALDDLAERRGLWIHCDETYRDADARPLGTWAATGPRWVATSTLTKCYGLGGLRLGWIAAHEEAMARCQAVHRGLSAEPSHLSATLALQLAPHLDALRARTHDILAANHARWTALAARQPALGCGTAHGLTVWCAFPGQRQGDAFAAWALERHDVAVHPGRFFDDANGVRVTLGGEPGAFAAALEKFEQAAVEFLAAADTGEKA